MAGNGTFLKVSQLIGNIVNVPKMITKIWLALP